MCNFAREWSIDPPMKGCHFRRMQCDKPYLDLSKMVMCRRPPPLKRPEAWTQPSPSPASLTPGQSPARQSNSPAAHPSGIPSTSELVTKLSALLGRQGSLVPEENLLEHRIAAALAQAVMKLRSEDKMPKGERTMILLCSFFSFGKIHHLRGCALHYAQHASPYDLAKEDAFFS